MKPEVVLSVVLREMTAVGHGWRHDWSDFDGRTLRDQLNRIRKWAEHAVTSEGESDFLEGSEFEKGMLK